MTRRFLDVHALIISAPFYSLQSIPILVKDWVAASNYSILLLLTLRLAERNGEDASHRLLQQTYDTSTRKSFDS